MSSTEYSAKLTPDPWLRSIVSCSGRCLGALGLVLILVLPLEPAWRAVAALCWLTVSWAECRSLKRGFDTCTAIRLQADGAIAVLTPSGAWVPASLLGGSMLLQKLAWLRLETAAGQRVLELVSGDSRCSPDWRRFQVIWRHVGA